MVQKNDFNIFASFFSSHTSCNSSAYIKFMSVKFNQFFISKETHKPATNFDYLLPWAKWKKIFDATFCWMKEAFMCSHCMMTYIDNLIHLWNFFFWLSHFGRSCAKLKVKKWKVSLSTWSWKTSNIFIKNFVESSNFFFFLRNFLLRFGRCLSYLLNYGRIGNCEVCLKGKVLCVRSWDAKAVVWPRLWIWLGICLRIYVEWNILKT